MKILFLGDISGRPGRETVGELLPKLKVEYSPDIVIANCENAAGGFGVTQDVIDELTEYGVDFFTSGDHVWGIREFKESMENPELPFVRPFNYERQEELPGKGMDIVNLGEQGSIVIINLLGQVFMREPVRSPFWFIDDVLDELQGNGITTDTHAIFIDFHAEATAEAISFGYYVRDRVTAVVGTHTHVPTADQRIIGNHTAFVSDAGMVGPLDASLWASFEPVFHNFKYPHKRPKQMEKDGRRVLNGVIIETNGGKATSIERVDRVIS